MAQLTKEYPDYVSLVNLGHSAQGREMLGLRISKPESTPRPPKKKNVADDDDLESMRSRRKEREREEGEGKMGFVITGAQHAREVRRVA